MTRKELKNKIYGLLDQGISKSEVFEQCSGQGVSNRKVAYFIGSHLDPKRAKKNQVHIRILTGILAIETLACLLIGFYSGYSINPSKIALSCILGIFCAIFPLWLMWAFYKCRPWAFYALFIMSIPGFVSTASTFSMIPTQSAISIGIGITMLIYAGTIWAKLFPDLVLGQPKRTKGKYIFTKNFCG